MTNWSAVGYILFGLILGMLPFFVIIIVIAFLIVITFSKKQNLKREILFKK